jgi:hypothetical protein
VRRAGVVFFALLFVLIVGAAGCKKKNENVANLNAQNKVELRVVRLYFEGPALLLMAEQRNVQAPQNPAAAMAVVVRELFKGATNPGFARTFPPDTVVRGAFLLPDGTAFVDLGGATLTQGWPAGSHEELMAVYSLESADSGQRGAGRDARRACGAGPITGAERRVHRSAGAITSRNGN